MLGNIIRNLRDAAGNVIYKCPVCKIKYPTINKMYTHVSKTHKSDIPDDMTVKQFCFHIRNKRALEPKHGTCDICKGPTPWNESTGKYKRSCGKKECKESYRKKYSSNMKKVYGTDNLMTDDEYQRKLQNARSISKLYVWKDGVELPCLSSYEFDFCRFCENEMEFTSDALITCMHTFEYVYEGGTHRYMPDFYMPDFNLIVEIKDGGDNPNMHHKIQSVDKEKEKLKDESIIKSNRFNYIKVVNKEYADFIKIIELIRNVAHNEDTESKKFIIHIPK